MNVIGSLGSCKSLHIFPCTIDVHHVNSIFSHTLTNVCAPAILPSYSLGLKEQCANDISHK